MSDQPVDHDHTGHRGNSFVPFPEPVVTAVLAIPDACTLMGEVRCLTGQLMAWTAEVRESESEQYTAGHLAVETLIAALSRLGVDHPNPVDGALEVGRCRCGDDLGLTRAVKTAAAEARARYEASRAADPGPGMYL